MLIHEKITQVIIGAAMEVHKTLGPGLQESAYETCLCHELQLRGVKFQRQVELPAAFKDLELGCGCRMDLVVEEAVIVELKAVEQLSPIHEAQLITYLRLSGNRTALFINFNSPVLKDGIIRRVL